MSIELLVTPRRDPALEPRAGAYRYRLDKDEILVGRGEEVDVRLPHPAVSWVHLRFRRSGEEVVVADEGSKNGTLLDGRRLEPFAPSPVGPSGRLEVGPFEIRLEASTGEAASGPEGTASYARRMVAELLGSLEELPSTGLEVTSGDERGTVLEIPEGSPRLLVGRGEGCHLRLSDADASRHHADVLREGGQAVIVDLGSKNGLLVNGRRVQGRQALVDGDEVRIANTDLRFHDPAGEVLRRLGTRELDESAWTSPPAVPRAGPTSPRAARPPWALAVLATVAILLAVLAALYLVLSS
jgi:pSer/pThr/pTyr-binding forkhead associated (FHA) protein